MRKSSFNIKKIIMFSLAASMLFSLAGAYWDSEWDTPKPADRYSKEALDKMMSEETSVLKIIGLGMIRLYQLNLSGKTGSDCNFYPSCSRYGFMAIHNYGLIKGSIMAADRTFRCNGYSYTAGYAVDFERGPLSDPVEDNNTLNFIFDWLNF